MSDTLSPEQQTALDGAEVFLASDEEDFIITGAAGTGKSYLVDYILDYAIDMGFNTHRTASTNKAAKVINGNTIHSLMGLIPQNDYDKGTQTLKKVKTPQMLNRNDVIIIDESSMIDNGLLAMICEHSGGAKLIFVGDQYQLPPVFESCSPALNEADVELCVIQRQALTSPIIPFATKFREVLDGGKFPVPKTVGEDIVIMEGKEFQAKIKEVFTSDQYEKDVDHCRVLAWTNNEVNKYNRIIRKFWYPFEYQEDEILVVNSPITGIVRNKEVVLFKNETHVKVLEAKTVEKLGIQGQELRITDAISDEGCTRVSVFVADDRNDVQKTLAKYASDAQSFQLELTRQRKGTTKYYELEDKRKAAWRLFFTIKNEFADVRPIHSSTVHKAQGSTYNTVFIDVDDISKNRSDEEIARLMYVAITRAKETVYLKGQLPRRLFR